MQVISAYVCAKELEDPTRSKVRDTQAFGPPVIDSFSPGARLSSLALK
jgi:hypothetical protein